MAKKKYDFKKLTLDEMMDYIEENAPDEKDWFESVCFEKKTERVAVPQFLSNGQPKMYQVKENGKPAFNPDGSPKLRQKVKMEEVEGGEKKEVFNLLKAKRAFAQKFMPDILPVKSEDKPKPTDRFKKWKK